MTTATWMWMVRNALGAGLVVLGLWLGVATPSQATETVVYYHTDALGSPVAVSNAGGAVIEHRTYESYGKQLSPLPPQDGPGYTGHVYDAATGLDYMQQRYYDPAIGRFLSVDPVNAYGGDYRFFNRYAYAFNNPYAFKDPDGRCPICAVIAIRFVVGASIDVATQHFVEGKAWGDVDLGDAAIAGVVSAAIPGLGNLAKTGYQGTKVVGPAAKAIAKVASKSANTANRAVKNSAAIARNVNKIEGAVAEVGKATVTAGVHQVVKAEAQSRTPEVTATDTQNAVRPPPPPPPPPPPAPPRDDRLTQP